MNSIVWAETEPDSDDDALGDDDNDSDDDGTGVTDDEFLAAIAKPTADGAERADGQRRCTRRSRSSLLRQRR